MSARTVYTLLEEAAATYGRAIALYQPKNGSGSQSYRKYDWIEYQQIVREIAAGLRSIGVGKGDIVALNSETRAEFYLADIGVMANGSISAAAYTSYPFHEQVQTLRACDPKAVFVENPKTFQALREAGADSLDIPWILLTGSAEGAMTTDELRERGREAMRSDPELFSRIQAELSPDDHAILYLTSGATGEPKMGLVTHRALLANCDMGPQVLDLGPNDRTLAFLPSAHITQRVVMELLPIRMGIPVWFSAGLSKMPSELRKIRPTFLVAPPRVWERMYSSIYAEIRKKPAVFQRIFYFALGLGAEANKYKERGEEVPAWLRVALKPLEKLVFDQIRGRLGGKLRIAASGAAPLGKELATFYSSIGMPLIEGYGLTEGGICTLNPINRPKAGSIGKPLPGVELRLDEDGELLVKSPCVFTGYYKDPETTASILRDGWLHTGDIAEFDDEGYVYITGRKKEIIVASNGKKIYPARIENLFKVEPLINQVVLIGDRLPYITALFTINANTIETIPGLEALKGLPMSELAKDPLVQKAVKEAVARVNSKLAPFEQIRKFRILDRDFSIENGEMTPTMKVRRARVLENFRDLIVEMYSGREENV